MYTVIFQNSLKIASIEQQLNTIYFKYNFFNNAKILTINFDDFNASLLNKSINFLRKKYCTQTSEW